MSGPAGESMMSDGTMDYLECMNRRIRYLIAQSRVPEDPPHAENTLMWLLKLDPDADETLRIAALGHDIERAVESRRLRKKDFADFKLFKAAHARNSADILREIMDECSVPEARASEIYRLVVNHETGGDTRSDFLKDADSISFFHVNMPYYYDRCGREMTLRRGLWGYGRISPDHRDLVKGFTYDSGDLNRLLRDIISAASHRHG